MSQKPVDIESGLQELRTHGPSAEVTARMARRLKSGPSRRFPVKPLVAFMVAAGAIVVVWPRHSELAWATARIRSDEAPKSHRASYDPWGKVNVEEWRDGNRSAVYGLAKGDKVLWENRCDGKRQFLYFDFKVGDLPNSFMPGILVDGSYPKLSFLNSDVIGEVLKPGNKNVQLLDQKRLGDRERYHIRTIKPFKSEQFVYAEVGTGLIREIRQVNSRGVTKIDYPDHIDDSIFEPHPQKAQVSEVIDESKQTKEIDEQIQNGIQTVDGVTLRLALLDYTGSLWLFWTGAPPDPAYRHPATIPGVKTGPAFGKAAFTTAYASAKGSGPAPALGKRLEGMALPLYTKIGSKLAQVVIPTSHGKVVFHDVPVKRIFMINHYAGSLGVKPY